MNCHINYDLKLCFLQFVNQYKFNEALYSLHLGVKLELDFFVIRSGSRNKLSTKMSLLSMKMKSVQVSPNYDGHYKLILNVLEFNFFVGLRRQTIRNVALVRAPLKNCKVIFEWASTKKLARRKIAILCST